MSGSSYSTSLRFEKQFTGENINLWGDKLDSTIDRLDDAIAGYVAISVDGRTSDYNLQSANTNTSADEARRAHLKFTGTLAAGIAILLPSVAKSYRIWNATNKTLTFSLGSGSTAAIETGDKLDVWSDGTNVNHATAFGTYSLKAYIAAQVLAATGSLPAVVGNAGKYVYTDGATSYWKAVATADLSDYATAIKGLQVALAVAL